MEFEHQTAMHENSQSPCDTRTVIDRQGKLTLAVIILITHKCVVSQSSFERHLLAPAALYLLCYYWQDKHQAARY